MAPSAEVRLHGRRVGVLSYDRGGAQFRYEADIAAPDHRVLGQIFEDEPRQVRRVKVGLPAWFANLLPEGELRRYVERELGPGRVRDFDVLCRLGNDLAGAVTVHPDGEPHDEADEVKARTTTAVPDHPLRHSLAGVQLKFSLQAERLTFPASGESAWWIVKLADRALPSLPANEYLMMRWLLAAGLDVPPPRLCRAAVAPDLPEGLIAPDEHVYLIPRFDRTPQGRVHVEDFAQVADVAPVHKYREAGVTYDSLGLTIRRLAGEEGFTEYIRRLAAMVVVGNTDAHLKNWALRYPDGRTTALAPVYDFHSLTVYDRYRYIPLALTLAGEEMPARVTIDHFRRLADTVGVDPESVGTGVRTAVAALRETWPDIRAEAETLFPALARHLGERLATLPLCQ